MDRTIFSLPVSPAVEASSEATVAGASSISESTELGSLLPVVLASTDMLPLCPDVMFVCACFGNIIQGSAQCWSD